MSKGFPSRVQDSSMAAVTDIVTAAPKLGEGVGLLNFMNEYYVVTPVVKQLNIVTVKAVHVGTRNKNTAYY